MKQFIVFLFFLILLLSPTIQAGSQDTLFQKAISEFTKGNYSSCSSILESLVASDPNNSLYHFNLGNSYYKLKQFSKALLEYEKVINSKSNLIPAAMLYKARCLVALEKESEALDLLYSIKPQSTSKALSSQIKFAIKELENNNDKLNEALDLFQKEKYTEALQTLELSFSKDSPKGYLLQSLIYQKLEKYDASKASAQLVILYSKNQELIDAAKILLQTVKKFIFWAQLDVNIGYDTNVYASSPTLTFSPVSKPTTSYSLMGGIDYNWNKNWTTGTSFNYSTDEYTSLPELNEQMSSIDASLIFNQSFGYLKLTPQYEKTTWYLTPTYHNSISEVTLGLRPLPWIKLLILAKHESLSPLDSSAYYMDGTIETFKIATTLSLSKISLTATLSTSQNKTEDISLDLGTLPRAHQNNSIGLEVSSSLNAFWNWNLKLSQSIRDYKNPSNYNNKYRMDTFQSASIRLNYLITRRFSSYFHLNSFANNSTFTSSDVLDKNYNETVTQLGVKWDIL